MHFLRVNGRGNAWPIQIGTNHAFYQEGQKNDYANASFSICQSDEEDYKPNSLNWEILIDAGHGIIPFILDHHNRIPEAIVLTHAHFDHILSVDWIVQSYYRQYNKQYPIYASAPCMEAFNTVLHHLQGLIEWKVLKVGEKTSITEAKGLDVTSYPVYHGYSAKGASILLFSNSDNNKKVLFTGDILHPLVKKSDLQDFQDIELAFVDCNNRFPYPNSNHWSFTSHPKELEISQEYFDTFELTSLLKPHYMSVSEKMYILDVLSETPSAKGLHSNILDFIKLFSPKKTALVHYSGLEDKKYYNQEILKTSELEEWANKEAKKQEINADIIVPETGDTIKIFS